MPTFVGDDDFVKRSVRVSANRLAPEGVCGHVASPHAYLPGASAEPEELSSRASADALPAIPPDHEELGEIVDGWVREEAAPASDDSKSSKAAVDPEEVRRSPSAPASAPEVVVEAARLIQLGERDLAEVVHVEFGEVPEDGGFARIRFFKPQVYIRRDRNDLILVEWLQETRPTETSSSTYA